MYRLFSIDEATALLPRVDANLGALQDRVAEVGRLREALKRQSASSPEHRNLAVELQFVLGEIHTLKRSLDAMGVQLADLERGTVEIPARVGGEMVYYVHAKGDDAITHYHRSTGDDALYPLPGARREGEPRRRPDDPPNDDLTDDLADVLDVKGDLGGELGV